MYNIYYIYPPLYRFIKNIHSSLLLVASATLSIRHQAPSTHYSKIIIPLLKGASQILFSVLLNLFLVLLGPFNDLFDPFVALFNANTSFLAHVGDIFQGQSGRQ